MAHFSHSPVRVARVALEVARGALPERTHVRARKDTASLPQLAACLVLQRFWRTSYRGLEAHLRDLSDVRRALGLTYVPDHTAYCRAHRALEQLGPTALDAVLERTVQLGVAASALAQGPSTVAVTDATGLTPSRATQYALGSRSAYARRRHKRRQQRARARGRTLQRKKNRKQDFRYPKWTPTIDRESFLILAQSARRGPCADAADFAPLTLEAHARRPSGLYLADAGFESSQNLRLCEEGLGARAVMRVRVHPRNGKKGARGMRCPYRRALALHLPKRLYRQRNAAESSFAAHKTRFGDLTPSRSERGRLIDVLLHGILHNCALLLPCATSQQPQRALAPATRGAPGLRLPGSAPPPWEGAPEGRGVGTR